MMKSPYEMLRKDLTELGSAVKKANKFFKINGIQENMKSEIAEFYFRDKADTWFHGVLSGRETRAVYECERLEYKLDSSLVNIEPKLINSSSNSKTLSARERVRLNIFLIFYFNRKITYISLIFYYLLKNYYFIHF